MPPLATPLVTVTLVKRHKTVTGRLIDLNLVMGAVIKAWNDRAGVGRPQVAMHRN